MKVSYNEFHVGRKIRDLCNFDSSLFSSSGNVVIKNMANVRKFAMLVNDVFKSRNQEDKQISAGQLNAMGLLDEIFPLCLHALPPRRTRFNDEGNAGGTR